MNQHLWRRIKYLLLGVAGFLLALLLWSVIEPYTLDQEMVAAEVPSLPQSWQGKHIAVVSDFQFGMWMANISTAERAIAHIVEDRPAAAIIAGDFVYKPGENLTPELNRVTEVVRPLTAAQIPTYAILGNHDYGVSTAASADNTGQQRANQIQQALESIGVQVLQNEAIAIPNRDPASGSEPFYLVGIGAHLPNQAKPLEAIAQIPNNAARFVLMHNPATFAELPAGTAPVAVAGHTHGGQIRIPFMPHWSWMAWVEDKTSWSWLSKIQGDTVRVSGWIPGYGNANNHLYINRGIGFSHLPIRFNCPPELTVFVLQRAT
ncbi:metallophosphoesterase [Leptolyngbya sp. AN02str]|uniref:metallophosphoesterase n=1 Tax=Leptolyngbya sp. AN02str TaxID=3423363 RepID=UPI003D311477